MIYKWFTHTCHSKIVKAGLHLFYCCYMCNVSAIAIYRIRSNYGATLIQAPPSDYPHKDTYKFTLLAYISALLVNYFYGAVIRTNNYSKDAAYLQYIARTLTTGGTVLL